ncbi:hypothetical protein PCE1_002547 [Barthelona sp. PCE]
MYENVSGRYAVPVDEVVNYPIRFKKMKFQALAVSTVLAIVMVLGTFAWIFSFFGAVHIDYDITFVVFLEVLLVTAIECFVWYRIYTNAAGWGVLIYRCFSFVGLFYIPFTLTSFILMGVFGYQIYALFLMTKYRAKK